MNMVKKIHRLLWRQQSHDALFHTDISVLAPKERVAHLSAHITKYGCRLAVLVHRRQDTHPQVKRILIDLLAISMSMANVLKLDAKDITISDGCIEKAKKELQGARTGDLHAFAHAATALNNIDVNTRLTDTVIDIVEMAGKIAKCCEAWDHLENYPYVYSLREETAQLFVYTLIALNGYGVTHIEDAYYARIQEVQSNNPFYSELLKQFDARIALDDA